MCGLIKSGHGQPKISRAYSSPLRIPLFCFLENILLTNIQYIVTDAVDLIDPLEDKALTVEEGTSTTLQCTAEGFPVPTITWYNPDGDMINSELTVETDEFGVINVTSTLSISNLQRNHSGRYTCSVIDETVVVNRTLTLKVNCKFLGKGQSYRKGVPREKV